MASMDYAIQVVLGVVMRRSICRLHEVVAMAVELGTALLVAIRFSGTAFRRTTSPSSSSGSGSGSIHYYYAPVTTSMVDMSRLDRH